MFFSNFWTWLNIQLATYVGNNTAIVAAAIEPAAVTLGTIYVMIWGYLSLTGRIQEPVLEGVKRIFVLAIIFGIGLRLWTYNELIVNTFYNAPSALASSIVGASAPATTIDTIWNNGGAVANELWNKGGILSGDFGFYLAGAIVYLLMGAICVYAMFLITLSNVALAVILALGPMFIVLLFFDATKRFFESWIAMLANYGLITVLTIMCAALLLRVVETYSIQTAALGAAIMTSDALNMLLAAALVFLVLRQVPSMAAGLASGIALSSFGAVGSFMNWGLGSAKKSSYEFGRGVFDGMNREPTSRWDSIRRGAGNRVGAGLAAAYGHVSGSGARGGTLVPRDRVMPPRSHR